MSHRFPVFTLVLLAGFARQVHGASSYTALPNIDFPNSAYTTPGGINNSGQIAGYRMTEDGNLRGFIRDPFGLNDQDFGPNGTQFFGINDLGQACGGTPADNGGSAIVRNADGTAEIFNVSVGSNGHAIAYGINNSGAVTGVTQSATTFDSHGFLRQADGTVTIIDVPGADNTYPHSINSNGVITGYYDYATVVHGFVRSAAGKFLKFDFPGSDVIATYPQTVNDHGQVAGYFQSSAGRGTFIRQSDGSIAEPEFPMGIGLYPTILALNNLGQLAGYHYPFGAQEAFLLSPSSAPPRVAFTGSIAGPPRQAFLTSQGVGAGLSSIAVNQAINCSVSGYAGFPNGTLDPVTATLTAANSGKSSSAQLSLMDVSGRNSLFDAVDLTLTGGAAAGIHQLTKLDGSETIIDITNGVPGLRAILFRVNGTAFGIGNLQPGQQRHVDISGALSAGAANAIKIQFSGDAGGAAEVVIHPQN